jgi:flagellar hook-length control protein FliK
METAQIMMMPVTAAAASAGGMCGGTTSCLGDGFGSLLGQTLALLEQSGIRSAVADGLRVEAEPQVAQQILPQGMPEVAIVLPQAQEAVIGEQEQQPLTETGGSQERALQLAGFLQAAMLVPTPTAPAPVIVTQAGETTASVGAATLEPVSEAGAVNADSNQLPADEQQVMVTDGKPEQVVSSGRPGIVAEHPVAAGRGVAIHNSVMLPQQPAKEAVPAQSSGQPATEQQASATAATEPVVRTDMARAATVAAAAEGKSVEVGVPEAPRGNATNVAQVRFAQSTDQVAASVQPEQHRQREHGQLGQQQAGLANSSAAAVTVVEQPEEAALFQVQMTAATDVETPHGHSMGVTIQRMAGGQLEVQAAEPAKVAAEAQLMRQVTDRLESHDMKQGTDRISLRLSPEHLGNLQLNLRMEDQQVRVEIVAEHRAVREALLQQVDQLKEILARQNIKMESFDVTTASNGGLTQQQQGDWRQAASERRPLYAEQYGASRSGGSYAGGAESSMQYFAQQYQSTLDVRF